MDKLEMEFSKNDMETVLDAIDEWANKDVEFLKLIDALKHIPDPDKETQPKVHEVFCEFKKQMFSQEKKAKDTKRLRREQAILLKAKLIMIMQKFSAEQIMEEK